MFKVPYMGKPAITSIGIAYLETPTTMRIIYTPGGDFFDVFAGYYRYRLEILKVIE